MKLIQVEVYFRVGDFGDGRHCVRFDFVNIGILIVQIKEFHEQKFVRFCLNKNEKHT